MGRLLLLAALMTVTTMATQSSPLARSHASERKPDLNIALHYGAQAPLDQLRAFDIVVVEPDHPIDPNRHRERAQQRSELYAYVSLGEVQASRPYFNKINPALIAGRNPTWDSKLIDQAHADWPQFFVQQIVRPLWDKGYRGFFLDTMDSYTLLAGDDAARARQQDGVLRTLELLRAQLPQAKLILNRGFEFLPRLSSASRAQIQAIAAESLFGRWDAANRRYVEVPASDRDWLLEQFRKVRDDYGIQPLSIEYIDPRQRETMRQIARRVLAADVSTYVTDGDLASVGLGAIEVAPRRILLLHEGSVDGEAMYAPAQRLLVMPLQYLGYRVDLLDYRLKPLPTGLLADQYAGVVAYVARGDQDGKLNLNTWYQQVIDQGVKLVVLNSFGVALDATLSKKLGIKLVAEKLYAPLTMTIRDPIIGQETEPEVTRHSVTPIFAPAPAIPLARVRDVRGTLVDGVAITPWGGFAMSAFVIANLPGAQVERWAINPIDFLARALNNPAMPVLDPSTELGRRVLMIHIDGDGFPSRSETPGTPFASEVMYRDFISRYPLPHTVSVIEAEIAPHGLYAAMSPQLESIARKIFALPNVEIATHTYSHPFNWRKAVEGGSDKPVHMPVPGYQFNLKREFSGSANYIDSKLAPPGKKTRVVLWSGDCVPPANALAASYAAGLLNMNGGDTTITKTDPSYTMIAPMSIRKDGWLQVFAPNQNENVYTNLWTGPHYGFDRVIETYELTESPRRLRPLNLYYHTYIATKPAGIASLHRIYQYISSQPSNPIFGSEYIARVHEFEDIALVRGVRNPESWRVVGSVALRTVRWPQVLAQQIDWQRSPGLAGAMPGRDGIYLHLAGNGDWFMVNEPTKLAAVVAVVAPATDAGIGAATATGVGAAAGADAVPATEAQPPLIVSGNGSISDYGRGTNSLNFRFRSAVAGELQLNHGKGCTFSVNGRGRVPITTPNSAQSSEFTLKSGANVFSYRVPEAQSRDGVLVSVHC